MTEWVETKDGVAGKRLYDIVLGDDILKIHKEHSERAEKAKMQFMQFIQNSFEETIFFKEDENDGLVNFTSTYKDYVWATGYVSPKVIPIACISCLALIENNIFISLIRDYIMTRCNRNMYTEDAVLLLDLLHMLAQDIAEKL